MNAMKQNDENFYILRPVTVEDESFLWQMLYYAAHMHDEPGKSVTNAMQNPALALYVQHWGRKGDLGFLAVESSITSPLGAVWLRLFPSDAKAYSQTDDNTPELAMAVLPDFTGRGIGSALLQQMIVAAKGHYPAIALNVRADNPALRLYQRMGFVIVQEMINRVGSTSYDMRLTL